MTESAISRSRIFISYRREETAYPAGWLFERLAEQFGSGQVFKDVDAIEPGDDFVQKISQAVASCDVLLVLIGKGWLTTRNENGQRRLDNPEDFVRVEVETALARNIRVIPILVDKAMMPRADDLPASLAGLTRRQAIELSPVQFNYDANRLLRVLNATLAELRSAQPGLAQTSLSPQEPPGQDTKEANHEPDEQKSTNWQVNVVSRSIVQAVFRLHSGSRQHFIRLKLSTKFVVFIDEEPEGLQLVQTGRLSVQEQRFEVEDEFGQILIHLKLTSGWAEIFSLRNRLGRVQITVDDVLVYTE